MEMKRVCVYCGSRHGKRPAYAAAARALGRELAQSGRSLVYGGGNVGLMGVVADAVLEAGGEVVGVIPRPMVTRELAHHGVTHLHVVSSMHERKALMAQLSDGFIALPGGVGTLDELFEIWTWAQLGIHQKPLGLLNSEGFYSSLVTFLDHLTAEDFVTLENRNFVRIDDDPKRLLEEMSRFQPGPRPQWMDLDET